MEAIMGEPLHTIGGIRLFVSDFCLKDTTDRMFPVSKNRSARIRKKLVRRFGGEFRRVPCIWQTPDAIFAHPTLYAEIVRQLDARASRLSPTGDV
jgi:hypothetical protein